MSIAGLGYCAAVVLALVFAAAATAKIRDRDGTAAAFATLGVPNAGSAARFLPLPELAAVVLLLAVPFVGALVVLVLLALFTTFIVGRLRVGVVAPCACFGGATSRPLSWVSVWRNVLMGALALVALGATRPTMPSVGDVVVVVCATALGVVALRVADGRSSTRSV